jgi:hypothetical protein
MRLRLVREPFDHPDYIFELKHDGFRAIAYLQHGGSKARFAQSEEPWI